MKQGHPEEIQENMAAAEENIEVNIEMAPLPVEDNCDRLMVDVCDTIGFKLDLAPEGRYLSSP